MKLLNKLFCDFLLALCFHIIVAGKGVEAEDETAEDICSKINQMISTKKSEKYFNFSTLLDPQEVGFSLELVFTSPVSNFQASGNSRNLLLVTKVSKQRWTVSIDKIKRMVVKKGKLEIAYKDENNARIQSLILNGRKYFCGNDTTNVYSQEMEIYNGQQICKPSYETVSEHSTNFVIKENFISDYTGLVVDVIFDSDVDFIKGEFIVKRRSRRHFSIINSGYIVSNDEPVILSVNVTHWDKAPPGIAAIVMNNAVICGFVPFQGAFSSQALQSISSELDNGGVSIASIDTLTLCSCIVSSISLLVAIIAAAVASRLSFHQKNIANEPIYSVPFKN